MERVGPPPGLNNPSGSNIVTAVLLTCLTKQLPAARPRNYARRDFEDEAPCVNQLRAAHAPRSTATNTKMQAGESIKPRLASTGKLRKEIRNNAGEDPCMKAVPKRALPVGSMWRRC